MKFIDKIKWRLDFLSKIRNKNLKLIAWNLLPARSQLKEKIIFQELKKCPLIKIEKGDGKELIFNTDLMRLAYPLSLRMSHFAGDFMYLIYPYIKNDNNEKISLFDFFPNHEGPYENGEIKIKEGDYVIDAGANIGMFSIYASKKVGSSGKVFSFEPISETQKLLKRNIEINEIKNVEIIPFALGDKDGELSFSIFPESLECSSAFFDNEGGLEKAHQISLDQFVKENNISKIDFIKADIEGMEKSLLVGASETIKKFKPKLSLCTYHRLGDRELFEKMIKDFSLEYKIIKDEKKIFAWV
ncbi:MAG: FkbM family methyltransferase [Candidatus Pacebacteria bacterium]|nr:FkbM family methyltransferase [Candidatus Paceibacterota bacterium]